MAVIEFPVIDLAATGENITKLRKDKGLSVRDIQVWFGFEGPQAIYKWQHGLCLPTVDNLIALSALLGVPMDQILVLRGEQSDRKMNGQQAESCCSDFLPSSALSDTTGVQVHIRQLSCAVSLPDHKGSQSKLSRDVDRSQFQVGSFSCNENHGLTTLQLCGGVRVHRGEEQEYGSCGSAVPDDDRWKNQWTYSDNPEAGLGSRRTANNYAALQFICI